MKEWHKEAFAEHEVERLSHCDQCGAATSAAHYLFTKYGLRVERCHQCGLMYVNPRLRRDILWQRYADEYFQNEYLPQHGLYDEQRNYDRFAPVLKSIENFRPKSGRLFEFGAAIGLFLAAARRAGWEVAGNELSQFAADYAWRTFGISIVPGAAETLDLPGAAYDAVTMFETIEHVRSPRLVLHQAAKILRPGGLLVLSTPNIGGLSYFFLRSRWWIVAPREHIFYFSPGTVRHALTEAGFRVARIDTSGTDLYYFYNTLMGRNVMPRHIRETGAAASSGDDGRHLATAGAARSLWARLEPQVIPFLQNIVHQLKLADTLFVYAIRS
jgi:2-polyprenyl-3-methyl-5-hydroxy-6-metoxy-1,4-benzoquinol methylase